MLALPQKTSKIAQETYLMRVSFSSVLYPAVCLIYPFFPIRAASKNQIMIIIEASGNPGFLERSSVRLKCTSFAIHEKMPPKVLNDVDEIVVELGLVISNRVVITIEIVINVCCESLEFSGTGHLSKDFRHQFARFQNIIENCGEDLQRCSSSMYGGSNMPPPKYLEAKHCNTTI